MSESFLIKFKGNLYSYAQMQNYLTHTLFNCIFCKSFLKIYPSLNRALSKKHSSICRTLKSKKLKYLLYENNFDVIEIDDMAQIISNKCNNQNSLATFKNFLGVGKVKKSKYVKLILEIKINSNKSTTSYRKLKIAQVLPIDQRKLKESFLYALKSKDAEFMDDLEIDSDDEDLYKILNHDGVQVLDKDNEDTLRSFKNRSFDMANAPLEVKMTLKLVFMLLLQKPFLPTHSYASIQEQL